MNKIKRVKNPNEKLNKWAYLFIAPFILTFLFFSLYPMISSIAYSFQNENETVYENFTTFSNYKVIFEDVNFWHSFIDTFIIFAMNFIPQIIAALFFAVLFTNKRIRMKGKGFFKFIYFLPNILTAATVVIIFRLMFMRGAAIYDDDMRLIGYEGGPFYNLLRFLGMDMLTNPLYDTWAVRMVIAFILFWMWFGNSMIVFITGINGISDEVFEAADVDGASPWRVFFSITLPILKPIMLYSLITSIIGGLQMFDIPFFMRGQAIDPSVPVFGGTSSTDTITIYIFEKMKYAPHDYGIAGAASVVLFAFSLSLSVAMYFLLFKEKNYEKKIWRRMKKYEQS